MNSSPRTNAQYFALYLVLAGAGLALLSGLMANDSNFVLYRFATHLASGRSLNYITPDATISTYPLVPLILSIFASLRLPFGNWLLCAISIATGALFMDRLTDKRLGVAYIVGCLIYPSPVMLIMLTLVLAGIDAAHRQRWLMSGVLMGLAILAEPSVLIPAALIILLAIRAERAVGRYLLPAALIPTLGLALIRFSLGDLTFISIVPSLVTLALPILALVALIRSGGTLRDKPTVAILVAWSAATIGLDLLRGTWPTAAILPGAIALVSMLPVRLVAIAAAAIDLILNLVLPHPSGQTLGQWIAAHSAPDGKLATYDIGSLAYYADRSLIDLSGRLQSNPFDKDFFLRSAPDLIVLPDNTPVAWTGFKTTYAQAYSADGQTVYQQVVNFTPLITQRVDVGFSALPTRDDLRLTAIAITEAARPGDLVRVRLDWQLNNPSSFDKVVKVTLVDGQGSTPVTAQDTIPAIAWTVGQNSTYLLLVLPQKLPAGQYAVNVELTLNNGNLGPHQVTKLEVVK